MATRKKQKVSNCDQSLVIYVHGIGDHPPRDQIKQQWDLALFGRDIGERSCMAYWADLLYQPKTAASTGRKRATRRRTEAPDNWQARLDTDTAAAAKEFQERLLERLGISAQALETPKRGPRKKVLPLPAWARRPISKVFLKAFISDTAAYFFAPGKREEIQQPLRDAIAAAGKRSITIVAHSQGSIIAYEVLSSLRKNALNLDALVTIGSPLGIQEVQDFLDPTPPKIPSMVGRWHNYADPLDPVALDKGIANDFEPNASGTGIQDEIILNDQTRRLWGFNPHSAVGYLAHPSVRSVVNRAMRVDSMARFIVARDVAERLGAVPQERHPVLIEVLEPGYGALGEDARETGTVEAKEIATLRKRSAANPTELRLEHRITAAADGLRSIVSDAEAARIDPLRRFVAAHLTTDELQQLAAQHKEMRVYAMWLSSRKSKLTDRRSMGAIKADAALASFAASGAGITWAVLDTGIQADHPHFKEAIVAVYDCTQPGPPKPIKNAKDHDGHGTHVAGVVAGRAATGRSRRPKDEIDLRGVAPDARLVIYKVLDDDGQGEDAWIIKAIDHIAQQNEDIASGLAIHGVNLSLGGPFDHTVYGCGFSPICAELRRLWRNGVLVVVACGNEGQLQVQTRYGEVEINAPMSVGDPANLEECIAVGAVNADRPHLYGISAFSSRGPTADGRPKPDVVAPGERILSCNAHWRSSDAARYLFESGTSMAAPHVSGLLAAFLSVRREFRGRPDEVKQILLDCCIDLGRDRYHQGHGMPNLMQMLLSV